MEQNLDYNRHIDNLTRELDQLERKAAKVYEKLRSVRKNMELHISDHALVRFLERVHGIDMESVKASILTPQLIKLYKMFGDGEFPIGDDTTRVVIENATVKTIMR